MIYALVVDDHPGMRRGLVGALRGEPGIAPLATASGMREGLAEAHRAKPDVALVDYRLAEGDGLVLCHELKLLPWPPAVLIYSAFARPELGLAAALAGADGMVDKRASLNELLDAIRIVVKGGSALPPLDAKTVEQATSRLEPEDLPILGMKLDGTTLREIASVLRLDEGELSRRVATMLGRLTGWGPPWPPDRS